METVRALAETQRIEPKKLPSRIEMAINTAKKVAERQVSAVAEDALKETYFRTATERPPAAVETHLQLAVDDASGRVFGRIVDIESGEVIQQIPSDEMLQLIAKTKEYFGHLVNEKV